MNMWLRIPVAYRHDRKDVKGIIKISVQKGSLVIRSEQIPFGKRKRVKVYLSVVGVGRKSLQPGKNSLAWIWNGQQNVDASLTVEISKQMQTLQLVCFSRP